MMSLVEKHFMFSVCALLVMLCILFGSPLSITGVLLGHNAAFEAGAFIAVGPTVLFLFGVGSGWMMNGGHL